MKMIVVRDIEALKRHFESRKGVAFAFLFGSQARGGAATKLSDIDIAVYFYPEKRHPIEYELDFMEVVTREAGDFRERLFEDFLERRTKTED
ncbi:MAG: hypothetical protein B6D35_04955 [Candidatus Brocadia sp. UTAMX2]|jgi:predicted nucleotidyltransferase|nr:MAG: hypothetical protein B6D35_04955 [Candidatus Brocadia sp. UTAMX2]